MRAAQVIRSAGGYATRGQLERAAIPRRLVDRAVRTGALLDAGRGSLVLPEASAALRAAARTRGIVACVSALFVHGWDLTGWDEIPHVVVRSTRVEPGTCWHRGRPTATVEPPLAAAVRALSCVQRDDALAVADGALRAGLLRRDLVNELGQRGGPHARWALRHADRHAESRLESRLRALLIDARIRGIELQAQLPGIGRVDLLLDGWLILEADGFGSHSTRNAYRDDRRRAAVGTARGYVTIRFSWEDVMTEPDATVAVVRAALARRRPGAFQTVL